MIRLAVLVGLLAACASPVVGVGLSVKIVNNRPVIDSLVPGGPAAVDGRLRDGDTIEAVAQGEGAWQDTTGMTLEQFVALVRGKRGTKVRLRAARGEGPTAEEFSVEQTRDLLNGAAR